MVTAVALFALAAWQQYHGYQHGQVTTAGLLLTLFGTGVLTGGGWLGGSLVFVYGTRVLDRQQPDPDPTPAASEEIPTKEEINR